MGVKTEHAGAKNGGGYWGTRAEAKAISAHLRRVADKVAATEAQEERSERDTR